MHHGAWHMYVWAFMYITIDAYACVTMDVCSGLPGFIRNQAILDPPQTALNITPTCGPMRFSKFSINSQCSLCMTHLGVLESPRTWNVFLATRHSRWKFQLTPFPSIYPILFGNCHEVEVTTINNMRDLLPLGYKMFVYAYGLLPEMKD
jgi:hypothetical protein